MKPIIITLLLFVLSSCGTDYEIVKPELSGTYITKDITLTFNQGHYTLARYNSEGTLLGEVVGTYYVKESEYEADRLTICREYQISYVNKCPVKEYGYSVITYRFSITENILYIEGFLYETFTRE